MRVNMIRFRASEVPARAKVTRSRSKLLSDGWVAIGAFAFFLGHRSSVQPQADTHNLSQGGPRPARGSGPRGRHANLSLLGGLRMTRGRHYGRAPSGRLAYLAIVRSF